MKAYTNPFKLILLLAFFLLFGASEVLAVDAVASFGRINGTVQVLRQARKIPGRPGLILNDQDVVVTGRNSRVTIIFRDGSEVRLFQDTRFVIEKSEEAKTGARRFFNNFRLKVGSFWGKFTKGRQHTRVSTPTATIGIKGTNVSMKQGRELDVSLSTGKISIENEDSSIELDPGFQVKGIQKFGTLDDKVSKLPFRIQLKPDIQQIQIPPKGRDNEVYLTVQLVETKTNLNVSRAGTLYFSLDIDKIVFPDGIELNKRGYARVRAVIKPFQKADYKNGQVEIHAIMDGEKNMDVGSGSTVLTYDVPKQAHRSIRIDMNTGKIE